MPTVAEVQDDVRTRMEAGFTALPLRWANETEPLPDEPTGFVFVELITEPARWVAYGGGRGGNTQRTEGRVEAHVMMPVGTGVKIGQQHAESICDIFRGVRTSDGISYGAAEVINGAGRTEDGNYCSVAVAEIPLFFDKTG